MMIDALLDRYDQQLIEACAAAFARRAADARRRGTELLESDAGAGRVLLGTARCLDECAHGVAGLLADTSIFEAHVAPALPGHAAPLPIEAERIPPSPASSTEANPL